MNGTGKSLSKGSAAPGPVPEGQIRLYSMRFCPFAQRAVLVLLAKGIKHEIVNINLKSKPDWFFEKSPFGLVPALETSDGKIIYDSPIVCEYLDEAFPGVKLLPSDPFAKAEQKMLMEMFSGITSIFYKVLMALKDNEDNNNKTELKAQLLEKLNGLDAVLAKKKSSYFGGDSISFIDYMIWPWFERFSSVGLKDLIDKTPNITAWHSRMLQNSAVNATFTKEEALLEFLKLYISNSVEACDYGLD